MKNLLSYCTLAPFAWVFSAIEVPIVSFVDFMFIVSDSLAWKMPFWEFCLLNFIFVAFMTAMWAIVLYDGYDTRRAHIRAEQLAAVKWANRRPKTAKRYDPLEEEE